MVYLDLVMLLNFSVDYLLLMGTNSLSGFPQRHGKLAAAAALGGVYAGACMLPGFHFLGNLLWRTVFLGLMAVLAFGTGMNALRRTAVFVLLSMALGGIAQGIRTNGPGELLAAAAAVALLCGLGICRGAVGKRFGKVVLVNGEKKATLTALYDTGNTLRDPISGDPVLVVGADVARELLDLTPHQLSRPVEVMEQLRLPGLRLIPYRAVGQPEGMLLAMRLDEVQLDGRRSANLVAFAPNNLGNDGYQALAGGI